MDGVVSCAESPGAESPGAESLGAESLCAPPRARPSAYDIAHTLAKCGMQPDEEIIAYSELSTDLNRYINFISSRGRIRTVAVNADIVIIYCSGWEGKSRKLSSGLKALFACYNRSDGKLVELYNHIIRILNAKHQVGIDSCIIDLEDQMQDVDLGGRIARGKSMRAVPYTRGKLKEPRGRPRCTFPYTLETFRSDGHVSE